ncbi:hypothetical protein [Legionella cardiaca]|uniref:Ankyrin repeat protein n=1 Tax=Legionella cardiaca TaxID=1071983 RepID=A0ABY8AUY4_9GAMM|nr:hypothetical protein [Legionella cardiaca]WED44478.1 hypothetical protein PXX05_06750 [Legionella cardiaca]
MPKPNDLNEIFSLLGKEKAAQENHFLFFLGTDTVFTAKPTITLPNLTEQKSYERGETLSYAAQVVVNILGEEAETGKPGEPLSYSSPSVDVLNGPTTLGSEVGERIAQGVFLALRAAANGKKTLQIPAHSRGAVETILVMSELARIKKALQEEPNKPLHEILAASPCSYTCKAAQTFFKNQAAEDTLALRKELLNRLNEMKINPFLIDPVPGGGFLKLPVGWYDERFFEQPSCNDYELLLYRDERTRCFTPIVPEGLQPIVIPGHHGTGSGNRYNQQLVEVSKEIENRDTTAVQDLVLYKLFHFLHRTSGIFPSNNYDLDLGHNSLDPALNEFLAAEEPKRYQLLLQKYLIIKENDAAYRSFSNGSYAYLGAQYAEDRTRFVHFRGHNHKSMKDVSPEMQGGFINPEHAMLYLREYVQFDNLADATPDVLVTAIAKALEELISQMMSSDTSESKLLELLKQTKGQDIFFEGLSILVDQISQKYLRNHLSAEETQKLREVITKPFSILKDAVNLGDEKISKGNRAILEKCNTFLQNGLKRTAETHYQSILEQFISLNMQIEFFLASPEYFEQAIFQKFLENLEVENDPTGTLTTVRENLRKVMPVTVEKVKEALVHELLQVGANDSLSLEQKEQINGIIASEKTSRLQDFFEAQQLSVETYLNDIEQLYNLAVNLQNDYIKITELIFPQKLQIDSQQLGFRCEALIKMGAKLLKEKQVDLRNKPHNISASFFALIKNEAIALGASSPELDDLTNNSQEQASEIAELKGKEEKLRGQLKQATDDNKELKEKVQTLEAETENQKDLVSNLQSLTEVEKAWVINKRLIPLTDEYLDYLLAGAKILLPELKTHNPNDPLPNHTFADEKTQVAYTRITSKFNAVHQLKQGLADTENVPLASQRLEKFKESLAAIEDDLNFHRDAPWKRFLRASLTVIAIVATGVIPGVIALFAYSKYSGNTLPYFFNRQTRGTEFVEESRKAELVIAAG